MAVDKHGSIRRFRQASVDNRSPGTRLDQRAACPRRSDTKFVGAKNKLPADLFIYEAARDALREIIGKVWGRCEGSDFRGRAVTLKVKFANF